jgi:hypothetical protein
MASLAYWLRRMAAYLDPDSDKMKNKKARL